MRLAALPLDTSPPLRRVAAALLAARVLATDTNRWSPTYNAGWRTARRLAEEADVGTPAYAARLANRLLAEGYAGTHRRSAAPRSYRLTDEGVTALLAEALR